MDIVYSGKKISNRINCYEDLYTQVVRWIIMELLTGFYLVYLCFHLILVSVLCFLI